MRPTDEREEGAIAPCRIAHMKDPRPTNKQRRRRWRARDRARRISGGERIVPRRIAPDITVADLLDGSFQAYNAGRINEAARLYSARMLDPEQDVTICLTIAGAMTPAGVGGSIITLMERGAIDFMVSTGANLYHDIHHALDYALHRGSFKLSDTDLHDAGVIRIYDVLFRDEVLLDTDRFLREIFKTFPQRPMSTAELHHLIGESLLALGVDAEHSVLAMAARWNIPIYTSSPGDSSIGMNLARHQLDGNALTIDPALRRPRDDGHRPRRHAQRRHHPRRRLAQELLPPDAAAALGGLGHQQGRPRLLHPDHAGRAALGRTLRRHALRGGLVGQDQARYARRHRRRLRRHHHRLPADRGLRRLARRPASPSRALHQARRDAHTTCARAIAEAPARRMPSSPPPMHAPSRSTAIASRAGVPHRRSALAPRTKQEYNDA